MLKQIKYILFIHWPIHLINVLLLFFPDCMPVNRIRGFLLRPFFKSCGKNLQVCSNVYFTHIENVRVGDNVFIGRNSWIGGYGNINIGNNVMIGPAVLIASANHKFTEDTIRFGGYDKALIDLGDEVWVGGNSSILAGVTIPEKVIVAAGSVVSKSILKGACVVGGVPAKCLRDMEEVNKG